MHVIYFLCHGPRPVPVDELFHDCRSGIIQIPLTATENFLVLSETFFSFGDLCGSSSKAVAGIIQKLQNRAAKVLPSASYDTSTDFLLDKLGSKYLKTQRKITKGTMVYKALNSLVPKLITLRRCLPDEVELRIIENH